MKACVQGGGRVCYCVSSQHFLGVCATANQLLYLKEVDQLQRLNHFPLLNTSLPVETLPGKMQLSFFSLFLTVMPKQQADKNEALDHQQRDSITCATDFQRGVRKIPTYYEIFSHSAGFIFPCLIHHFLPRHFLAKCSFQSSVCSLQSSRQKADENMALSRQQKELAEQNIRKTKTPMYCEIFSGVPP